MIVIIAIKIHRGIWQDIKKPGDELKHDEKEYSVSGMISRFMAL